MRNIGSVEVTTPSEREVAIQRSFNAPRTLVFDALTKPDLVKRWLTGPPGWSMVVCEIDFRVGGSFRYVWSHQDGRSMGMGGVHREIVAPERIVATEKFDEAWYPGEALDTTDLVEQGARTILTITVLYDSEETRDAVIKTGMAEGMAASYDNLELLLGEIGTSSSNR